MLDLFNVEKPSKWCKCWLQNGDEGGDYLQMSLNTPFEGKYFEKVQWEDDEPLQVSLVPTQALRGAKKLHVNLTCALHKLHYFQSRDKVEGTAQALRELEGEVVHVLQYLSGLTEFLSNGERIGKN